MRRDYLPCRCNYLRVCFRIELTDVKLVLYLQTREELREALENEMRGFNVDRELGSNCIIAWNHTEFEVQYHCLSEEIKIGR